MVRLDVRFLSFLLLTALATPARAGDVSVRLDSGAGFSVRNGSGSVERLRVDEATGNVSRNGALFVHTTGAATNLFVGPGAGNLSASGSGGTAFGNAALTSLTAGSYNSAFGAGALRNTTSGGLNSAVGAYALYFNTIGGNNSAFGSNALALNTTGSFNSAVGLNALRSNLTGSSNSAFGYNALFANTASRNSAFGRGALFSNTTGNYGTAVGNHALYSNVNGIRNTAVGSGALGSNTSGSLNVAIGEEAGINQTTGSFNIYIGNPGVAGESARIRIGTGLVHAQTAIAGIHGATSAGGIGVLVNNLGVLGTTTSSARFKEDVRDMGEASDVLMKLRPVAFRYREEVVGSEDARTTQYGLIAEEVAEVAPELVAHDLDGKPYSVKYHELPALLLGNAQAQERTIAQLEARIAELEMRLRDGSPK